MKRLPGAGPPPLPPGVASPRRSAAGSWRRGPDHPHSPEGSAPPPPTWTGPGPNHMSWTERGESRSARPSPRSPLCNLLISFRRETGAHSPTGRGAGALLPGPHARRGRPLPVLPGRGAQVFLLCPKGGEGTRCYRPRPQCHSVPPARLRCPVAGAQLRAGSLSPVSRVPGAPAPRAVAVSVPQGSGGAERAPHPLRPRVCMGESSFHGATGRCGAGQGGRREARAPGPGPASCLRRHSVITGKENCFKTRPCGLIY